MLNSAEEQSHWYLRLNGFFLLNNFVIHKSENVKYTSDMDLLGVRPRFVYEEIGGKPEDWDKELFNLFKAENTIGIITQVKGGALESNSLFHKEYISYCLNRFGFIKDMQKYLDEFVEKPLITFMDEYGHPYQIVKLLISRDEPKEINNFVYLPLSHIYNFIIGRLKKYPKEKYRDRNFFTSLSLQTLIELEELKKRENNG